jgi:hypothetical protein
MRNLIEDSHLRDTLRHASAKQVVGWAWQGAKRRAWQDFFRQLVYKDGQAT